MRWRRGGGADLDTGEVRCRGAEWRSPLCEALLNEYVGTVSRLVAAPVAAKDAAMQGGVA